jgi:hypothetical protein
MTSPSARAREDRESYSSLKPQSDVEENEIYALSIRSRKKSPPPKGPKEKG